MEVTGARVVRLSERDLGEPLSVFALTVWVQRIAVELAEARGVSPDRFRYEEDPRASRRSSRWASDPTPAEYGKAAVRRPVSTDAHRGRVRERRCVTPVLSAVELTKRFGDVTAVSDLSFELEAGSVTGFLGPNGAGKTTTLRMLLGLAKPTRGHALVFGRRFAELERPATRVGAVLEAADLHPGRTGRDHLRVLAPVAHVPPSRVEEVLALVDLKDAAGRRVGGLFARHASAPEPRRCAARRSRAADPRRARERARSRGGALAARLPARVRGSGQDGASSRATTWPRSRRRSTRS